MGSIALEEGDVIMFGHPHGKDIKPGQTATSVIDSEFEFLVRAITVMLYSTVSMLLAYIPLVNQSIQVYTGFKTRVEYSLLVSQLMRAPVALLI